MSSSRPFALSLFLRPFQVLKSYPRISLRPDLIAGLTVAVILLPQAIAYSLIAELPPQMGLYSAVIAAVVGSLWGSSNQLQTGPTNTASLLVLSALMPVAASGSPRYLVAAGMLAVLVGVFRLLMGVARLGMLVNFVSDSVIIGFTTAAGVLIGVNQLRPLLQLDFVSSPSLPDTLQNTFAHLSGTFWLSLALGGGVIVLIAFLRWWRPQWPGPLIAMIVAAALVGLIGIDKMGVTVIGELPRNLPPLARLPLFDLRLIGQLSPGALAVGAIGLVEAISVSRSIASQSGQRLSSNQEFVGQGLANIACGFFSGYVVSGSFTRSAVNYKAGAQTPLASIFSGSFVLIATLALAPLAAYVPRTALAGVLILTALGMIDHKEISRILKGARGDALIMGLTFVATLLLPLEFAVLAGILASLAIYILRTSTPRVVAVLPDDQFRHLLPQPEKNPCSQLAILDILGDLYFGAVSHVERAIHDHLSQHPEQRFLLLRLRSVNHCDISGIHGLESILRTCRDRGGDMFVMRVHEPILKLMHATGFYDRLGNERFLPEDQAISHLFHKILDPAICVYECEARAFLECQHLPRRPLPAGLSLKTDIPTRGIPLLSPRQLWHEMHTPTPPLVIDVREPREIRSGHIPGAQCIPLLELLTGPTKLPQDRSTVFVCRGGRRSARAAYLFLTRGHTNLCVLEGGMLAWENAGLLEALPR